MCGPGLNEASHTKLINGKRQGLWASPAHTDPKKKNNERKDLEDELGQFAQVAVAALLYPAAGRHRRTSPPRRGGD